DHVAGFIVNDSLWSRARCLWCSQTRARLPTACQAFGLQDRAIATAAACQKTAVSISPQCVRETVLQCFSNHKLRKSPAPRGARISAVNQPYRGDLRSSSAASSEAQAR